MSNARTLFRIQVDPNPLKGKKNNDDVVLGEYILLNTEQFDTSCGCCSESWDTWLVLNSDKQILGCVDIEYPDLREKDSLDLEVRELILEVERIEKS